MVFVAIYPHDYSRFPKLRSAYRKESQTRQIAEWHGHAETPYRILPRQRKDGSVAGGAPDDLGIPPAARNVFEEVRGAGWSVTGFGAGDQDGSSGRVQFRPASSYVDAQIPADITPGEQPLSLTVNGVESNVVKIGVR